VSHPQTPEAIEAAKKGDWTQLQRIFGWQYISDLRRGMNSDDEVVAYLEAAH
jgi:hypothetical protein